jgi:penicillin-binding protein 1C
VKKRVIGCGLLVVGALAWIRFGPIDPSLLDATRFQSVTVLDRHGEVLYQPLSAAGGRGEALATLPENVVQATLAAEDRRFFSHPGVDPIAVVRAAWHNVRRRRVVEGGSTLTQQVAKMLLGSRDRSMSRKARETLLALRLEHRFTKREILTLYLNLAPYGNQVHGVSRASRFYFGCAPEDLTVAQAAFLAALPQRPTAFNPLRDPRAARERQEYVLRRMNAAPEAYAERLRFNRDAQPLIAQHYVERVLRGGNLPQSIRTSLDAGLQRDVAGVIAAHRRRLLAHGATSVAVVVLDNRTGRWLAWEGSGDYFGEQFGGAIDGAISPRQPGSTLKPFTYALAFEQGRSPATVLQDVPSHFPTAEPGIVYTPRNYDGRFRGPLRIREALATSQNVPAVAMLHELSPASLLQFLRSAGFTDLKRNSDYYGLGLTLGDAEVRLDELVVAYSKFVRGGLVSQRTAFLISDILSDADARQAAFGSGGSLDFPFRVAVKTGTSQAYRDNWTVGYTRDVTVGVWVGNFDRTELRNSTGVTGAAPIFHGVMLAATKRVRGRLPLGDFDPIVLPDGVGLRSICALSGHSPTKHCPVRMTEWLPLEATLESCALHRPAAPKVTSLRVTNPPDGATYMIDPTLRSGFQKLKLQATRDVSWFVNGRPVDREWPLKPGKYRIAAVDAKGARDEVRIYVK